MRILLVEDDVDIVRALAELLVAEGYQVDAACTQADAIRRVRACQPDLVLLDVTLAEGNGFAVCGAIRQDHPDVPVVFLTASDDEFNTVTGLSMGAEDYIAKPFRPRELLARIAAVLRRRAGDNRILRLGPLAISPSRARVTKAGAEIPLSAVEYRLLLLFATNPGHVVTREMMREALWESSDAYIEDNTLYVYMRRLREKIEDDPAAPTIIETVRGVGYRSVG
ncbi:MAG: response regulator transcription factor [Acidobacteriota bacterium]|nr:response regulator transcription factor [Acidobacteriota bacterium]